MPRRQSDGEERDSDLDIKAIYQLGRADFRSGYPRTWTPHLGTLAQDEIAWGVWVRGWDDEQIERELLSIKRYQSAHPKK